MQRFRYTRRIKTVARAVRAEAPIKANRQGIPARRPHVYTAIYIHENGNPTMPETRIAKLFKNGASQAVRLPAEFRFEGEEVYATRDETTGDVVLSSRPGAKTWGDFFEMLHAIEIPDDFMGDRPMNVIPSEQNVLRDEEP